MSIELPEPIAAYIAGEAGNATDIISECFIVDAMVYDEGEIIQGHDAIKTWKSAAMAKYRYTVEPLGVSQDGDTVKMPARLTGNFPGSPAEVEYTFVLAGGKIASLEIK